MTMPLQDRSLKKALTTFGVTNCRMLTLSPWDRTVVCSPDGRLSLQYGHGIPRAIRF